MIRSVLCKVLQRRTYDILSRQYGVLLVFGVVFVLLVASLQFGQVALEWSKEKYSAITHSFSDNIGAQNYRDRLCLPVPIDIVYTWVNGSDPRLMQQLQQLKYQMEKVLQLNTSQNKANRSCTYENCFLTKLIVVDPMLPDNITTEILARQHRVYKHSIVVEDMKSSTGDHDDHLAISVVHFKNQLDTNKAVGVNIFMLNQRNYTVYQGYLTSDDMATPSLVMKNKIFMSGFKGKYTSDQLLEYIPNHFRCNIQQLLIYEESNIALITVNDTNIYASLLKHANFTIDGKVPVLNEAYLVWKMENDLPDEDVSSSRYQDNEEMKYSLRSIEKFAPWVRNIYIVTNGQIPSWLNLEQSRVKLVTHEEIFQNKSHLPTYSSPAIETHIHRIPGLSQRFIYMNDDVFFGKAVWPDDFYTHATGQKVYLSWSVPNCREGCPSSWIKDGYCDKACNNSVCDWDAGDCTGKAKDLRGFHYGGGAGAAAWNRRIDTSKLYCHQGCANSWLADRYCDQACNVKDCGFDHGDCGTGNFGQLTSLTLSRTKGSYALPRGSAVAYLNMSALIIGNVTIKEARYAENTALRTATIANKLKTLHIIVFPEFNETTLMFQLEADNQDMFSFNLTVFPRPESVSDTAADTVTVTAKALMVLNSSYKHSPNTSEEVVTFGDIPEIMRRPDGSPMSRSSQYYQPLNLSTFDFPPNITNKLHVIEKMFQDGDITQRGYHSSRRQIWQQYVHLMQKEGRTLATKNPNSTNKTSLSNKANIKSTSYGRTEAGGFKSRSLKWIHIPLVTDQKHKKLFKRTKFQLSDVDQFWQYSTSFQSIPNKSAMFPGGSLPWEKSGMFNAIIKRKERVDKLKDYQVPPAKGRHLLDTFAESLRHVNKIYNRKFGYTARKVPGHMPHMIDKIIMEELQQMFSEDWQETSSHKVRSSNDMQFSFSYFYFLMSQPSNWTTAEVFQRMDTDNSGILSDREIRTLVTRLYDLPLDLQTLTKFESLLVNCSQNMNKTTQEITPPAEEYYNKYMPQASLSLLENCQPVKTLILQHFKSRTEYKFETVGEEEIAFKMIQTNVTNVVTQLDDVRKHPKKFVCLNDNIDHKFPEAETVKAVLQDFFESMFPIASQFELPPDYRNKFLYIEELQKWQEHRKSLRNWTHLAIVLVILVTLYSFFQDKIIHIFRKCLNYRQRRRHIQNV